MHRLVVAARGDAAAPRLAHGGPSEQRLVCGVSDQPRPAPDRRCGAALPRCPTSRWRASWAEVAPRGTDAVAAVLGLRLARRRPHRHRPLARPWWQQPSAPFVARMVKEAAFDLHIVSMEAAEERE
jgi:hypothetical protein